MPAEWRDAILAGVKEVPSPGSPGSLVVCGLQAEPVFTTTSGDVLMAAAEYGSGRVVAFSHDGFAGWFVKGNEPESAKLLKKNILNWVTKGQYTDGWQISDICKGSVLNMSNTVVVWYCDPVDTIDVLLKYVMGGGNLLVGITPWGNLMSHPERSLETIPHQVFLKNMGIYLTGGCFSMTDPTMVADNKASEAHTGRSLQGVADGSVKPSKAIICALNSLPLKFCAEVLKEFGLAEVKCAPPTKQNPLPEAEFYMAGLANLSLKATGMAAPGIDQFPGSFASPPATSSLEVSIDSEFKEYHPVGAYLPAGGTLSIQFLQGDFKGWWILVGCHTDNLSTKSPRKLYRWPDISVEIKLTNQTTEVSSPFGGSIYVWSPAGKQSVKISLKNVVPSPIHCYGGGISEWEKSRQNPGLWADFVGKHIVITVPSKEIRDLADPDKVLEFWDSVVFAHNDLKCDDLNMKRKEWIVPDMQPSVGYMHAGYPIVTEMDVAVKGTTYFLMYKPADATEQDHWGFFHELGHNMQESAWTFAGTGEVTCNIFSLNAMHRLFGYPPWDYPWLQNKKPQMKSYLANGAVFKEWQDTPGVALGIYAQLARDFGFDAYKQVFLRYKQENPSLSTDQEKIDHWVVTFSETVKHNLVPVYKIWGIPVSEKVSSQLEALPPYKIDDEIISTK